MSERFQVRIGSANALMPEYTFTAGEVRGLLTMPEDWVARGFLGAVDRCEQAMLASGEKIVRDVAIPLFEAGTWIDSLARRRPALAGDVRIQGFRFVRHQAHHQSAPPYTFDHTRQLWVWQRADVFPDPDPGFETQSLERAYGQALEDRPVTDTPRGIADSVRPLVVPDRRPTS